MKTKTLFPLGKNEIHLVTLKLPQHVAVRSYEEHMVPNT